MAGKLELEVTPLFASRRKEDPFRNAATSLCELIYQRNGLPIECLRLVLVF